MTVVAVLADPPREELALPDLVADGVLEPVDAAELYAGMVQDAMLAVARSGGELLVNYPPADDLPGEGDPEAELRTLAEGVLDDLEDVRFEVQVGSEESARVGNTITHLLEREDADTAAILRPTALFTDRTVIDSAAMKLRRDDVVLGPAPDGRIYYAGFTEPIDFEGALEDPAIETLARRGAEADLAVDFEAIQPVLERPEDLETVEPLYAARRATDAPLPAATEAALSSVDGILDGPSAAPERR